MGETRVIYFESQDDGTSWRVTTNSSLDASLLGGNDSAFHLDRINHTGSQLSSTINADVEIDSIAVRLLANTDNGKLIVLTNGGAVTVTIPNSLAVGFACNIVTIGSTTATFVATDTRHPATGDLAGDGKAAYVNRYQAGDVMIIGPLA